MTNGISSPTLLMYFCYSTGWVAMSTTAGNSVNTKIIIDASSDFQINYMTIHVRQSDLLVSSFAGDLQIEDSGRGRTFFNTPVPIDGLAGTGRLPYPFNPPRVARKNSSLTITLTTNVTTATDVNIVLHGNKLFGGDISGQTESALV